MGWTPPARVANQRPCGLPGGFGRFSQVEIRPSTALETALLRWRPGTHLKCLHFYFNDVFHVLDAVLLSHMKTIMTRSVDKAGVDASGILGYIRPALSAEPIAVNKTHVAETTSPVRMSICRSSGAKPPSHAGASNNAPKTPRAAGVVASGFGVHTGLLLSTPSLAVRLVLRNLAPAAGLGRLRPHAHGSPLSAMSALGASARALSRAHRGQQTPPMHAREP